jgi:hypothetical protein
MELQQGTREQFLYRTRSSTLQAAGRELGSGSEAARRPYKSAPGHVLQVVALKGIAIAGPYRSLSR